MRRNRQKAARDSLQWRVARSLPLSRCIPVYPATLEARPFFHYCRTTMSFFSAVELAPRDPILGLNEAFNADTRATKVNLGVGVYTNEEGKIPLLRAVRDAEKARIEAALPRGYLPIEGIAAYDAAVQKLLLGNDSPLVAAGRVVTAQALGGTGALKIGAD